MPAKPNPPASPRGKSGLLADAATLLYGPNYIVPLATLLKRDRRTVRRWLQHEHPIPLFVWNAVNGELEQHYRDWKAVSLKVAGRCDVMQSFSP